eukprot:Phypoly_transcript_18139.p1 GENE.Phypoly_transcript_18139~~Phypoly_transcript_18139.p1  ORF type:complete len:253 (-),score=51.80 Phypoly_transcript_18139:20-724(-)
MDQAIPILAAYLSAPLLAKICSLNKFYNSTFYLSQNIWQSLITREFPGRCATLCAFSYVMPPPTPLKHYMDHKNTRVNGHIGINLSSYPERFVPLRENMLLVLTVFNYSSAPVPIPPMKHTDGYQDEPMVVWWNETSPHMDNNNNNNPKTEVKQETIKYFPWRLEGDDKEILPGKFVRFTACVKFVQMLIDPKAKDYVYLMVPTLLIECRTNVIAFSTKMFDCATNTLTVTVTK